MSPSAVLCGSTGDPASDLAETTSSNTGMGLLPTANIASLDANFASPFRGQHELYRASPSMVAASPNPCGDLAWAAADDQRPCVYVELHPGQVAQITSSLEGKLPRQGIVESTGDGPNESANVTLNTYFARNFPPCFQNLPALSSFEPHDSAPPIEAGSRNLGGDTTALSETQWQRDEQASLRRECDVLRQRREALMKQIRAAEDSNIHAGRSLESLSCVSTDAGQSFNCEDRWGIERHTLQTRIFKLEEQYCKLKATKLETLPNPIGGDDGLGRNATKTTTSMSSLLRELAALRDQTSRIDFACAHSERCATEAEQRLIMLRADVEEPPRVVGDASLRRRADEARELREQLDMRRRECLTRCQDLGHVEESIRRTERSHAALCEDRNILMQTRHELMHELAGLRGQLESISSARLEVDSSLSAVRREQAAAAHRWQAELEILQRQARASDIDAGGLNMKLEDSVAAAACAGSGMADWRQKLSALRHAHNDFVMQSGLAAKDWKAQVDMLEATCAGVASRNKKLGTTLSAICAELQHLRISYPMNLKRLQQTAEAVLYERRFISGAGERLRSLTAEMVTHAGILANHLDSERGLGNILQKEVAAAKGAVRPAQQQVRNARGWSSSFSPAARARSRGCENTDPWPNVAGTRRARKRVTR